MPDLKDDEMIGRIAEFVGLDVSSFKSDGDVVDGIMLELDKRLMPVGLEWPKSKDGEKVGFGNPVGRSEQDVLDADGLPIKVGDTVYHEVDESTLVVTGFGGVEDGERMVYTDGKWSCVRCLSVSHKPPDTQERLDEDFQLPFEDYYQQVLGHSKGDWLVGNHDDQMREIMQDIVRRQNALDAKGGN